MIPKRSGVLSLLASIAVLLLLAVPAAAQRNSDFMKEFRSAIRAHDTDAMTTGVKRHQLAALKAVMETCELIAQGSSDELEEEIAGLGRAWKKAFGTDFVSGQYEYFSLLDPRMKAQRRKLLDRYSVVYPEFEKARGSKDKGTLSQLGFEFEGLAKAFQEVGDGYMASSCAWHMAACFEEDVLGKDAELRKACTGYGLAVAERERIQLKDSAYDSLKARLQELEYAGYGDPSKGPEGRAAKRAEEDPAYAPRAFGGVFETAPDTDDYQRLFYAGDPVYQTWFAVYFGKGGVTGKGGSAAKLPAMANSPVLIREGFAKVMVDTDGDGKGDVEVPVTGRESLVNARLPDGRPWAFRATVGLESDTYQGIRPFNIAPSDESMTLYIAPASSIVATVDGHRVQVFDDNMDGMYGGEPLAWSSLGTRKGDMEYVLDSVLVQGVGHAAPFSRMLQVGDQWYLFEPTEGAADLTIQKTDVSTGVVKLEMKGPSCDYLILQGIGNLEGVYINVAGKGGVDAPSGSYELLTGRIRKGKRDSTRKALICKGKESERVTVAPGKTTKLQLGAPFGFEFVFNESEDSVTVRGNTIVVVGRGGEVYERFWDCVPNVDASIRPVGAKKGSKGIKMRPVATQYEMVDLGWESIWFPVDRTIPKTKKGKDVQVQLTEKKNKLFGKIVSDWKEN